LREPDIFNTKSTSSAKDLLYIYDSLAHFQYIHNHKKTLTDAEIEKLFITYQALGWVILSNSSRKVVLIDENDKAPGDLPNDILDVIEKMWFEVPEIKRTGTQHLQSNETFRPIVILTSNSEKNLPDTFLRRCIFSHISFPTEEQLIKILKTKILENNYIKEQWHYLVEHFSHVREIVKCKKPATAELIYWASVLQSKKFNFDKLKPNTELNDWYTFDE